MANSVFYLARYFGKCLLVSVGHENRIVTESRRGARAANNRSPYGTFEGLEQTAFFGER